MTKEQLSQELFNLVGNGATVPEIISETINLVEGYQDTQNTTNEEYERINQAIEHIKKAKELLSNHK